MNRFKQLLVLLAVILLASCVAWGAAVLTERATTSQLRGEAADALGVYVANLEGELDKYEALPQIFAGYPLISRYLQQSDDKQLLLAVNQQLETFNTLASALNTYLLDRHGVVVASDNWQSDNSFIGEDLSFRPYFRLALSQPSAGYFALGTTSGKRGYYFSAPVRSDTELLGVMVVKVDMASLESAWQMGAERVVVSDEDGVIFISSIEGWLYHSLKPLDTDTLARIQDSRRYSSIVPESLPVTRRIELDANALELHIKDDDDGETTRYLKQSTPILERGWVVHSLKDLSPVYSSVNRMVVSSVSFFLLLCAGALIWYTRAQARAQREAIEREMNEYLQKANDELETQVQRRTEALTRTNSQLRLEIKDRRQAEQELRSTQDQLVQAAKMAALGQMASSITHELNQPLSAIRTFADTAGQYIEQERSEEAAQNLNLIGKLSERMASIMNHLKSFSRKAADNLSPVSVDVSIDDTLTVLQPAIRDSGATLNLESDQSGLYVIAEPIRLQQVLTNLLQNALDAVKDESTKTITLDTRANDGLIALSVSDSGPGIPDNIRDQLFEPFFTTKEVGQGLGLGLSITYGIVADFGGKLELTDSVHGGACFVIQLQQAKAPAGTSTETTLS